MKKIIIALVIASALVSCSTVRVYERGSSFKPHSKKSELTGWAYGNK